MGEVSAGERPPVPENADADLVAIVQRCWAQRPQDCPSARDLLPLLAPYAAAPVVSPAAVGGPCPYCDVPFPRGELLVSHIAAQHPVDTGDGGMSRECVICMDAKGLVQGIACRGGGGPAHFVCDECFGGHVRACCQRSAFAIQEQGGIVVCPCALTGARRGPACTARPFEPVEVAHHASAEYSAYMRAHNARVEEAAVRAVLEEVAREEARRQVQDAVSRHVRHIENNILINRCPACLTPFDEWEEGQCFAVRCLAQGCGSFFCGWCLTSCGVGGDGNSAAHHHAPECGPLQGRGAVAGAHSEPLYGTIAEFHGSRRVARAVAIRVYLETSVPIELRLSVRTAIAVHVTDLDPALMS